MKWSQVPPNNSPALADYLMGVTSGGVDDRVLLSVLKSTLFPQRTRRALMGVAIDQGNSANLVSEYGAGFQHFTNAPTAFMRTGIVMPSDYVPGTNATIKLTVYSILGANGSHAIRYYLGSQPIGASINSGGEWNVASNLVGSAQTMAQYVLYEYSFTIPASFLAAGNRVGAAFQPSGTPAYNTFYAMPTLEYTADS